MKKILSSLLVCTVMLSLSGCFGNDKETNEVPAAQVNITQFDAPKSGDIVATMKTSLGEMKFKLLKDVAPKAVENFVGLANKGYYNGLTYHRVMNEFMVQGGDPTGTGAGGESIWGEPFKDEFDISTSNYRGALSMANTGPNTNSSQFFIVQANDVAEDFIGQMKSANYPDEIVTNYKEKGGTPWLDGKHTVFGQMYEGYEVLDKIATVEVDSNNKPVSPVTIETVTIEEIK